MSIKITCENEKYFTTKTTLEKAKYFSQYDLDVDTDIEIDRSSYLFGKILNFLRGFTKSLSFNFITELNYYMCLQEYPEETYIRLNIGGKNIDILREILIKIPYFEVLLSGRWKLDDNIFVDCEYKKFKHVLKYIENESPNFSTYTKYKDILSYFGIDFKKHNDKKFLVREKYTYTAGMGTQLALASKGPVIKYLQKCSICESLCYNDGDDIAANHTELIIDLPLELEQNPDKRTFILRNVGIDLLSKIYIKIYSSSVLERVSSPLSIPYNNIKSIKIISLSGVVLYERTGSSLFHYRSIDKRPTFNYNGTEIIDINFCHNNDRESVPFPFFITNMPLIVEIETFGNDKDLDIEVTAKGFLANNKRISHGPAAYGMCK